MKQIFGHHGLLQALVAVAVYQETSAFLPRSIRPNHPSTLNTHGFRSSSSTKQFDRACRQKTTRRWIFSSSGIMEASTVDQNLAISTFSFASLHIGMSAIRRNIIQALGQLCVILDWVGNPSWQLPALFRDTFGDDNDTIFPDAETAGRQLYRALYTAVSFVTLGSAIHFYLESQHIQPSGSLLSLDLFSMDPLWVSNGCFWTAVAAQAAATASLVNASPLGLMPGFQANSNAATASTDTQTNSNNSISLKRNDSLKFQIRGLTRITRHPLILPVVPWGVSNALLLGGDTADWILFGGLALYAILGCAAQDLRVSRQEGSVGTTFGNFDQLQVFFEDTSFVPFGAVIQGKQSIQDITREVPWAAFLAGAIIGVALENALLQWLS